MSALNDLRMWREVTGRRDEFIRAAKADGMNIRQIGIEAGVSRDTVYAALRGGWQLYRRPAAASGEATGVPGPCGNG